MTTFGYRWDADNLHRHAREQLGGPDDPLHRVAAGCASCVANINLI
jgi:hypothetical protein